MNQPDSAGKPTVSTPTTLDKHQATAFGGAFRCPHCTVLASQTSADLYTPSSNVRLSVLPPLRITGCSSCNQPTIWSLKPDVQRDIKLMLETTTQTSREPSDYEMVFPLTSAAPPVNRELPDMIKKFYNEASKVLQLSPASAAALLRLCLQMLCVEFENAGLIWDQWCLFVLGPLCWTG
jgi:hypothetical protein